MRETARDSCSRQALNSMGMGLAQQRAFEQPRQTSQSTKQQAQLKAQLKGSSELAQGIRWLPQPDPAAGP